MESAQKTNKKLAKINGQFLFFFYKKIETDFDPLFITPSIHVLFYFRIPIGSPLCANH